MPQHCELVGVDGGDVPREHLLERHGDRRADLAVERRAAEAVARDERAPGEVAEPLVVLRRDDRDRADEVEQREEVDDAERGSAPRC